MPNWVKSNISITGSKEEVEKLMAGVSSEEEPFDFDKISPMPKELNVVCGSISEKAMYLYISANRDTLSDERILKVLETQKKTGYGAIMPPPISVLTPDALTADEEYQRLPDVAKSKIPGDIEYLFDPNDGHPRDKADYLAYGKIIFENYEKYGYSSWYRWAIENWGTKWNTECVECETDENDDGTMTVEYSLNTAWSAPIPIFQKLSQIYDVEVKADFADEDCGHNCGTIICRGEDTFFEDHEGDEDFAMEVLGY